MKKFLLYTISFLSIINLYCVKPAQAAPENQPKILIAYYSYTGNTRKVAEVIQEKTGGDLFEIQTVESYPAEYEKMALQAKLELANNINPKLKAKVENIADYDVVFIGSPNWWGNIAPAVSSFMAENDLKNKKVIPFITHGGRGEQNTFNGMKKKCVGCDFISKGYISYQGRTWGINSWIEKASALK